MNRSVLFLNNILRTALILFFTVTVTSCVNRPEPVEHGIFAPSRLESVIGQDGVCSIEFSEEITLWTFADTITGRWKSEKGRLTGDKNEAVMDGMLSNSIAWSNKITGKNYRNLRLTFFQENGETAQFIKNKKDENPLKHRFWAMDGFRSGNKVYVYYLHVYVPDSSKFLDFEILNVGLARWDIPHGWMPGDRMDFRRLGPLFKKGSPFFGAAVMQRDGYVYLAGHFKKNLNEFPVSIARVKAGDVENRRSYSFLSSSGDWVKEIKKAGGFIGEISGECSLSYNDFLREYIIIYSQIYTGNIYSVRFKDFSQLPFAAAEAVYRVHKTESSTMWPYSGKEIFSSGSSLYLIYIDPMIYQPFLVELMY